LLSYQRKKGKRRVWRQFCEWLSEAAAHLPTAVSLLLLEVLFMQISGVSLTLTWPLRLCLLRVLLGATATATSFPLSKHTGGGDTAPAFSNRYVYLQLMWEVSLSPLSSGAFLPLPLLQAFPLLVAGWVLPLLPSLAGVFVYSSMRYSPPPLFGAQGALPSLLCVFFVVIAYYFFLFSLGGGWSVQGAMLIWPMFVCGSTTYHLAHLVVRVFPSHLGAGIWWQHGRPPGFSILHEVEMLCAGWRCGGVNILPLLSGFSCKVYLQHLSKILL
jgi:hypothetical protein